MRNTYGRVSRLMAVLCLVLSLQSPALAAPGKTGVVFLGESLSTFGAQPDPVETAEVQRISERLTAQALWNEPGKLDDYLARHPSGAWSASLRAELGGFYRRSGFFTRALEQWTAAWASLRTREGAAAREAAAGVLGNLIELNAALGRLDALEPLLAEAGKRNLTGHAREQFSGAKQAFWMMQNQPDASFRCGPVALYRVLKDTRAASTATLNAIDLYPSTAKGTSLAALESLAAKHGIAVAPIRRIRGAAVAVPSIVHWKSGHFAAVISERDGLVEVADPTFGQPLWMPREALEDETSGYQLVLAQQKMRAGWSRVERAEAERVWGKGNTGNPEPGATTPKDPKKPIPDDCEPEPVPSHPPTNPPSPPMMPSHGTPPMMPSHGYARYNFHIGIVSLNLIDTPVSYIPPRGPMVPFTVTYNSREAFQPSTFNFSNLGGRWVSNWVAYVEDNTSIVGGTVRLAERGGGSYFYSGYNASTGKYAVNRRGGHDVLRRINSNGYERRFADGSVEIYSVTNNGTTQRKLFLSTVTDRNGNTLTLLYDQTLRTRVVAIRDGLSRSMTIEYGLASDPYKITRVVDPFGRAATFGYDASGRLITITDTGGFVSRFTYGPTADAPTLPADFINQMETPYGPTRFRMGESGTQRWLQSTDATGAQERVEFVSPTPGIASTTTNVPAGFTNDFMHFRNSFFWSRRGMLYYSETDPDRYRKATVNYHWLHNGTGANALASSEPESVQMLGHRRVWYAYPGQTSTLNQGTLSRPSVVTRVLDDGSEERFTLQYTASGTLLRLTDPVGRRYRYVWDATETDLLEVYSDSDIATPERLAKYEYDAKHRPIRYTDAAGQLTQIAYNTFGQITSMTLPDGTAYNVIYNAIGLAVEFNRAGGNRHILTWDGLDRVSTWVDPLGFTTTVEYDDIFDRVSAFVYPDGTAERYEYDRFDPVSYTDRHGGVLTLAYDTIGNVVSMRDAAGRSLSYEWCGCGSLEKLTDARGNATTWLRDDHDRVTAKYVAGQLVHEYNYDSAGRLLSRRDAKGQSKRYDYTPDGHVRRISYSGTTEPTAPVDFFYNSRYPRLDRMIDGLGETLYTWHPVGSAGGGNIATIDGPFGNDTIAYGYDTSGRVSRVAINNVETVQTYDSLGRLATRRNALGTFTPAYDGTTSRITSVAYPNGQRRLYSYHGADRFLALQSMRSERFRNGVWETLSNFTYDYQLAGGRSAIDTITSMTIATNDPASARQLTFQYDPAWQLTGSTTIAQGLVVGSSTFGYDTAGNRISEDVNGLVSVAAHNELNRLTDILRQLNQPASEELAANQQKARALAAQPATQSERRDQ
ncbi:MAG TPA: cysteine peptidase family C39 domain-containing protein [Thermoanaerobaculia bacterium]|nr:cysteine peptidase family C39 domain-containing protein [Thermoanaerobaculia bacterium]